VAPVARDLVRQLGPLPGSLRLRQPQKKRAMRQAAALVTVDTGNVLALRDVKEIQHGEMLLDRHFLRVHSRLASSRPAQVATKRGGVRTLEGCCLHSRLLPSGWPPPWPCSSTR